VGREPQLSSLVIGTSALISILGAETDRVEFLSALQQCDTAYVSAATLRETFRVAATKRFPQGQERLEEIVEALCLEVIAFDVEQLTASRAAYAGFGRGSGHAAKLNFGDCFAYALAKTRNLPLLYKGDDLIHTDIIPALKPA